MMISGILAYPNPSGLLKTVHVAGYKALNLHAEYKFFPVPVEKIDAFFSMKVKKENICLSVGYPYKESIVKQCNEVSVAAKNIGAINTIYFREGKIIGHNTEFLGIRKAIEDRFDMEDMNMVVLGSGSLARSAIYAGIMSGANVTVLSNDLTRAKELGTIFDCEYGLYTDYRRTYYDIVVQTTASGMGRESSTLSVDQFHKNQIVLDCVYSEKETLFLKNAQNAGAEVIHGGKVFLYQAYEQFKFFTGKEAPKEIMESEYFEALESFNEEIV